MLRHLGRELRRHLTRRHAIHELGNHTLGYGAVDPGVVVLEECGLRVDGQIGKSRVIGHTRPRAGERPRPREGLDRQYRLGI